MAIRCEKCGRELPHIEVNRFNHEGDDCWYAEPIIEHENGAFIDLHTPNTWCGAEFDADSEEARESIRCPHCYKFPFKCQEIQEYNILRVVMFANKT